MSKARLGRPPDPTTRKTKNLSIRCPTDLLQAIDILANGAGISRSQTIITLLQGALVP
jgi:metal-responsive CopG/Arc/MetJ family transcriptional regulator